MNKSSHLQLNGANWHYKNRAKNQSKKFAETSIINNATAMERNVQEIQNTHITCSNKQTKSATINKNKNK